MKSKLPSRAQQEEYNPLIARYKRSISSSGSSRRSANFSYLAADEYVPHINRMRAGGAANILEPIIRLMRRVQPAPHSAARYAYLKHAWQFRESHKDSSRASR